MPTAVKSSDLSSFRRRLLYAEQPVLQVSVALQLSAIFEFNQQSQQLKADFMLVTNWTDSRYVCGRYCA
jgi:hypothetical protein